MRNAAATRAWVLRLTAYMAIACASSLLAGCIPFSRARPEAPRSPDMVQRFAAEASALGIEPAAPRLPALTRTLARAVEALPWAPTARELGTQIDMQAQAMEQDGGANQTEHARQSLTLALRAVGDMKKPAGSPAERRRAVAAADQAVEALAASPPPSPSPSGSRADVEAAYRAVARALLVATGGGGATAKGSQLTTLVARFAVEDSDQARRTGAQLVYAMAAALDALPARPTRLQRHADTLSARAQRLAGAATLDYSAQMREALIIATDALAAVDRAQRFAALHALRDEARAASGRIDPERPFELQRAVVQDAVRLLTDAITVAAAR